MDASEIQGAELDFLVGRAEGLTVVCQKQHPHYPADEYDREQAKGER